MANTELLEWLRGKLSEAEKALHCRLEMAESFERMADPKYWEELKSLPGVIATKTYKGMKAPTVQQNKNSAASHRRIAASCVRDVDMFKAAIEALSG